MVSLNSEEKLSSDRVEHYENEAFSYWDKFYGIHDNRFFKDRNWLFTELPELSDLKSGEKSALEIGCGAGNTVYPILESILNKGT